MQIVLRSISQGWLDKQNRQCLVYLVSASSSTEIREATFMWSPVTLHEDYTIYVIVYILIGRPGDSHQIHYSTYTNFYWDFRSAIVSTSFLCNFGFWYDLLLELKTSANAPSGEPYTWWRIDDRPCLETLYVHIRHFHSIKATSCSPSILWLWRLTVIWNYKFNVVLLCIGNLILRPTSRARYTLYIYTEYNVHWAM